ncbi:hypothetical protein KP79_PYT14453 [Mizuhopecten yessoensis]|uniref:Uncharacterized protein n=1 Tax=Mizuhopecten yessoensis TaxID=6573 RepID=A0A210QHD0_MIZYE|nr:hypothetical protein KP79_PYT14453 [Mizuhopecten yessoensis]
MKSLKKTLKGAASGPAALWGKTWPFQLSGKVESVATHMHWSVRNCGGNAVKLRQSLENITEHYKHQDAKQYPNYDISRIGITVPKAERLLIGILTNSTLCKHAEDYRLGRDTFYVESFNNVINIYQDKRIAFSDDQYTSRANLAVCHCICSM